MSTLPPELDSYPHDDYADDRFARRRRRNRRLVTVLASLALLGMLGGVVFNLIGTVQNQRQIEEQREQQRIDDFFSLPES